ncbi:hypothetical protein EYC82_17245 [Halieaceae bacterium IMCC11814]|uniref:Uncharacterized protein n=1 Tax=Candidatus Marimicrobium litorale TaxID=2518991 RepID=A0ABT3T9V8_9GAMM|nr:hypothetical protein [Candidatus Marimicrobium litorale]
MHAELGECQPHDVIALNHKAAVAAEAQLLVVAGFALPIVIGSHLDIQPGVTSQVLENILHLCAGASKFQCAGCAAVQEVGLLEHARQVQSRKRHRQ